MNKENWKYNILALTILAIVWQIVYYIANESLVFPDLLMVVHAIVNLFSTTFFWQTYLNTIQTLFFAWIISVILSLFTAYLCNISYSFRKVFERYCNYFTPLPSFSYVPFFILLFGFGKSTVIGIMVLSTFWSSTYQTLAAFDKIKEDWQKHIINLQWNALESLRHVYIPASYKVLLYTCNMNWTYMWRVLISLEIAFGSIGGYFGMGTYIINVKNTMDIDKMYAVFFIIAITGMLVNSLFENAINRVKKVSN
jgi:NitT/TauT family transport system permease protein